MKRDLYHYSDNDHPFPYRSIAKSRSMAIKACLKEVTRHLGIIVKWLPKRVIYTISYPHYMCVKQAHCDMYDLIILISNLFLLQLYND